MKASRFFILFILLTALNLSACVPRPADCRNANVYCIGLVTASGSLAQGINQAAWLALQAAKSQGLADRVDAIETVDARDRARNIAVFGDQGYDLIVTAGYVMGEQTGTAALKYPHSKFIGIEQPQTTRLPNLVELVFHDDQGGFLAGALAATISQTRHVGAVCEAKFIDSIRRACESFQAGARYVAARTQVTLVYREGPSETLFNDPIWGSTSALQLVNNGADVIFAAGGGTAEAALEAVAGQDVPVIGWETDVYTSATDIRPWVVSSAVDDIQTGILNLIQLARADQFPAGEYFGQVHLAGFHDWERRIPENDLQKLNEIQQGLKNGSIQPGVP